MMRKTLIKNLIFTKNNKPLILPNKINIRKNNNMIKYSYDVNEKPQQLKGYCDASDIVLLYLEKFYMYRYEDCNIPDLLNSYFNKRYNDMILMTNVDNTIDLIHIFELYFVSGLILKFTIDIGFFDRILKCNNIDDMNDVINLYKCNRMWNIKDYENINEYKRITFNNNLFVSNYNI